MNETQTGSRDQPPEIRTRNGSSNSAGPAPSSVPFFQDLNAGSLCLDPIRDRQAQWEKIPLSERTRKLKGLRRAIAARADEIIDSVCTWTGKVPTEALLGEVYPVLDLLRHYEKKADSILRPRKVPRHFSFPNASAAYQYKAHGVAAVFSPWNLPFQLSAVPAFSALTAANAVILKPSEVTPGVGDLLLSLFQDAGYPEGILTVVSGGPAVGEKLIRARPDFIFFTGGCEGGRAVMKAAAENLIPVALELGGKDPMIVFEDAPWERSLNAAVYGAFCNAGQVCMSVQRLLVAKSIHDRFVECLLDRIGRLRVGTELGSDIGPMTTDAQADQVERQIREALARGAEALPGLRRGGRLIYPLLLTRVRPEMPIFREETFGPVLPIVSFQDEGEAIALANDTAYGLNASVWTLDLKKGREVADRLDTGCCAVNDVIKNAGHPDLPFGGVKHSGFGRYHGPHGLWTFCRPVSVLVNSGRTRTEANWFPYSRDLHRHLLVLIRLFHSGKSGLGDWIKAIPSFRFFRRLLK
jgi:acyl-CoA reductase-like NAD-dependent aldehyde dehydrogenase